ncbi:hypothetical protein CQW23_02109 [Capsicum baccatum]|uniref:Essential protein Yae1 N-terminal domain-containing protein n=1 Tax=Capsicum baccatum TaxID=33114 RepID=A0A2G2XQG6_CAPBA|nr:hypothetical protein CQW23_02109 [Capsicum baccatum]
MNPEMLTQHKEQSWLSSPEGERPVKDLGLSSPKGRKPTIVIVIVAEREKTTNCCHCQIATIGYRDGLMAGEEASAQEGFNVGFRDSVYVGYNWGLVRVKMLKVFHDSLSKKLKESVENDNSSFCLVDSNDLSSNDNLLKNYQKELQSLIDE